MERQTNIIALDFRASRAAIDVASDQLIEQVRSGERNPLDLIVWMKAVDEILERVKKEIRHNALAEGDKYPEKTFDFAGAKLTKAEHGTKYDYEGCGDTKWERLHSDFAIAKGRLSEREEFLRALKEPLITVDEMTGEVVTIRPPVKTSVSGLNVSIR